MYKSTYTMQLRVCVIKIVNIAPRKRLQGNFIQTHMSLPNIVFVLQLLYCVVKVVDIARHYTVANVVIE